MESTAFVWSRGGENLLEALQSFYVGSRACVRVGSEVSAWFTEKRYRDMDALCLPAVQSHMDGVVREVNA